jgi:two-component system nitrogen regulation response regulator GlnG
MASRDFASPFPPQRKALPVSRILVVDDEPSICWGLSRLGRSMGHRVDAASSAEHGLSLASAACPDLIVLDVRLPGMDGLAAMELFRRHIGGAPIIVMTAFGDLATAVTAVENGAFEYIVKPFDLAEIRTAVERALRAGAPASNRSPVGGSEFAPAGDIDGMLGRTTVMHSVFKRMALAAKRDAAVLLHGENGVGKEFAARSIHRHSSRSDGPFVTVNVTSLSPTLAEAELFGHVAGAFAGASQSRRGLLMQANGGTLFLDEVADIPLPLQVKLLRAIDRGEVLPVGGDEPAPASFRVISATDQDLRTLVPMGAFRQDLFFRLCTFEISLPPLRERRADISLLAHHFVEQFGAEPAVLAEETLSELTRRPWYGNVRELRNAIEHALVVARSGAVLTTHLPDPLPQLGLSSATGEGGSPALDEAVAALANLLLDDSSAPGDVYERFLNHVEPPLLAAVLTRNGNRCAPAARALGLHRTTLKRKLDQYGIDEILGATD